MRVDLRSDMLSRPTPAMRRAMEAMECPGDVIEIRKVKEFERVHGAILPGGESTTIYRLLRDFELFEPLRRRVLIEKIPVLGTCAGMVLLACEGDEQVERSGTKLLGLVDAKVCRNAFGRQRESFEAPVVIEGMEEPFPAVFIRAPAYERVWGDAKVLASMGDRIILARQDNVLASAFHPELTGDLRLHGIFLNMVRRE